MESGNEHRSEQRREQRLPANARVTVTVLGILGNPTTAGAVLDMSGSGLRLKLPLPLPCGAPVKVESGDMLMLGEVVRCEMIRCEMAESDQAAYSVAIHLSHSLAALSELSRLNRALLGHDVQSRHDVLIPESTGR